MTYLPKDDLNMAEPMMTSVGCIPKQFEVTGQNAVNYQAVRRPHCNVSIKLGNKVLDMENELNFEYILTSGIVEQYEVLGFCPIVSIMLINE